MMRKTNGMSLTGELRDAIESSGVTLYRIAKDSGVSYAVLHRFANGERQIKLDSADKLADYFGMRLMKPKRSRPPKTQP
jgi:transcriptional regulator with XRE-family HTH domain